MHRRMYVWDVSSTPVLEWLPSAGRLQLICRSSVKGRINIMAVKQWNHWCIRDTLLFTDGNLQVCTVWLFWHMPSVCGGIHLHEINKIHGITWIDCQYWLIEPLTPGHKQAQPWRQHGSCQSWPFTKYSLVIANPASNEDKYKNTCTPRRTLNKHTRHTHGQLMIGGVLYPCSLSACLFETHKLRILAHVSHQMFKQQQTIKR